MPITIMPRHLLQHREHATRAGVVDAIIGYLNTALTDKPAPQPQPEAFEDEPTIVEDDATEPGVTLADLQAQIAADRRAQIHAKRRTTP